MFFVAKPYVSHCGNKRFRNEKHKVLPRETLTVKNVFHIIVVVFINYSLRLLGIEKNFSALVTTLI